MTLEDFQKQANDSAYNPAGREEIESTIRALAQRIMMLGQGMHYRGSPWGYYLINAGRILKYGGVDPESGKTMKDVGREMDKARKVLYPQPNMTNKKLSFKPNLPTREPIQHNNIDAIKRILGLR